MNNFSIQSIYNWYRSTIRNPKYRWWMVLGTLIYIFSPFDIAPDFFFPIGEIDDIVILSLLVSEVSQMVIEAAKARKGTTVAANPDQATDKTVDVDAVSVK